MAYDINALVVDDDNHVRSFLTVLMRRVVSGTLTEASNGREAVDAFVRVKPDITLLDVNMPIVDGITALRKIREIDPSAVVILLTSLAMRRVVQDALDFGASNFIRKDTPKDDMIEIVRETIRDGLRLEDPESPQEEPATVLDK